MVDSCHVCGEALDAESVIFCTCRVCGRAFHMALQEDSQVRDCGQVVIGEETTALQFTCAVCLREMAL